MPIREVKSSFFQDNLTNYNQEKTPKKTNSTEREEEIFIPEIPKYTFDDLILASSVKENLLDIADYIKNSHIVFDTWGFSKTHRQHRGIGINLYGPPGTGKTMAAHALAAYMKKRYW